MSAPKQTIGLTNFAFSISKCPPNPDAIRSIVFTKCDNLAVVNGANTEILIPLTNFYVPVDNAARLSFSLPGATSTSPTLLSKMDLGGLDLDGKVKFLCLMPQYGTGTTQSGKQYIEWTSAKSIEDGYLYDQPADGPSSITGLDITQINKMEFSWGGYISFTGGTGSLWAATNGGLVKWDGTNMSLWNTLNSNSPSDYINCLAVSSYGMWVGSNMGVSQFNEKEGFKNTLNTTNSPIGSDTVNDIKYLADGRLVIATDGGLSIYNSSNVPSSWISSNIYNSTSLLYNKILKLQVTSDPYVFAGTTGGVFMYDVGASAWGAAPFNSSTVSGWSAGDSVQCLEVYYGNLYVGTSTGLVVFPYAGGTATTYTTAGGATGGPVSNDIKCLRFASNDGGSKIYMGHDIGFSIFDLDDNTWFSANPSDFSWLSGQVSDILVNTLEPSILNETILLGSPTNSYGMAKFLTDSLSFSLLPSESNVTNLLLAYPGLAPYPYSPKKLYANNQPLYFVFSKAMNSNSFQNSMSLGAGLTGAGGSIGGSWIWDNSGRQAAFYPGGLTASYLDVATQYSNAGSNQLTFSSSASTNIFPGQQVFNASLFDPNTVVESIYVDGSEATVTISKPSQFVTIGDNVTFKRSSQPLQKSQLYNLKIGYGSTASDSTYLSNVINVNFYTENVIPIEGWKPIGKMLVLSGTEENYTDGIYLRNPQSSTVNNIALVGR